MIRKYKFSLILFILIAMLLFLNNIRKTREYTTHINDVMDTFSQITLITREDGQKYISDLTELIRKYDKMFSHTDKESEIYLLNNSEETNISKETYDVINSSKEFYEETQGAFDITIGAVSELWSNTFESGELPQNEALEKALKTVDYSSLIFDNDKIKRTINSQQINLGAVAKGYIADKAKEYLVENKINNALINLGGNIYARGKNKNGDKWNIGVLDPKTDDTLLTLKLSDKFVITSGNYLRYKDINSIRYHHIIDAKTGYPANNELNSVTIISDNGFLGDALSTSCFLLGYEKSKILLEKYDVCAIFATKDNKLYYSKELENSMQKLTENYEFIKF